MLTSEIVKEASTIFRQHDGILRTSEALELGIHPRTLYAMRGAGVLERLARGLYRLADLPPLSNPDLVTVALKVPDGVICLVSALAFHELTTGIPHAVDVAMQKGSRRPRLEHPPLRVFWFSGPAWREGGETYRVDEVSIRDRSFSSRSPMLWRWGWEWTALRKLNWSPTTRRARPTLPRLRQG